MEATEDNKSSDSGAYDIVDTAGAVGGTSRTKPISPEDVFCTLDFSRNSGEYFMGNGDRGIALIFNHQNFEVTYNRRAGTDVDKRALMRAFISLDFEVRCFDDLKYEEIINVLQQVSTEDHRPRDCIAVAVLSHGAAGDVLFAWDHVYHVSQLVEPFTATRCPSLKGKPKLFFIQADRTGFADGISDSSYTRYDAPEDILISHSTYEGTHSFRNEKTGTWYVQTLCTQLEVHGRTKDLVSLLTDVSCIVNESFRARTHHDPDLYGSRQQPCFISSLKRRLWFR